MINNSSFGIGIGFGGSKVILLGGSSGLHVLLLLAGSVRSDLGRDGFDLCEGAAGAYACRTGHAAGRRATTRVAVGTRVEAVRTFTRGRRT